MAAGRSFARIALFSVEDRVFRWQDVALAAHLWGGWGDLEAEVRQGLACQEEADETAEGPTEEEIEATASEYRYERDLLSAEEMEAWLDRRGLSAGDWMDYLRRRLLRRSSEERIGVILAERPPEDDAVVQAIRAEALLSGAFERWAARLAGRAAIAQKLSEGKGSSASAEPAPGTDPEPSPASPVAESLVESGLLDLTPEECHSRLRDLARMEKLYERFTAGATTPTAIRAEIGAHRLDWILLEYAALTFPDESGAREAALCLREDREPIEEVARRAGVGLEEGRLYLEEMDEAERPALLAARSGDVVGPIRGGPGHRVILVRSTRAPSEGDPEVRGRAERALIAGLVDRESRTRVRWHERAPAARSSEGAGEA